MHERSRVNGDLFFFLNICLSSSLTIRVKNRVPLVALVCFSDNFT